MKYISLSNVIEAFQKNTSKTTDGFWGIISILLSIGGSVKSGFVYNLDYQKIADQLEKWFSIKRELKVYNSNAKWFVVFSTEWEEQLCTLFLKNRTSKESIYDIIVWTYQNRPFQDDITSEKLLGIFLDETSLSVEVLREYFDFTPKDIQFSETPFTQNEKVDLFTDIFGNSGENNSIKSSGTYIVAEAGVFQRAPFIQTLFASTENFKCLLITSSSPEEYYSNNFTKKGYNNLLKEDELIKKVRDCFYNYWKVIDQHGAEIETYIRTFENAINPLLTEWDKNFESIFQIVDYNLLEYVIQELIKKFPTLSYLTNERSNHGNNYRIGSTLVHYKNFIKIITLSDFRANIDKEELFYKENFAPLPHYIQQIFFGAPGVGKSHHLKSVYNDENDVIRVTFHPETDYASFVGCYKPQTESNQENGEIVYKFQGQAFTEAYIEAWNRYLNDVPRKDVFLVIEEINRGNCAQIFGDIFQLLDRNDAGFSDYSVRADKDLAQYLEKIFHDKGDEFVRRLNEIKAGLGNGTCLLLPPNFHILATMNTSDQSLFPIDSAFKRRWEWVYMPIETEPVKDGQVVKRNIEVNKNRYDWGTFLKEVNNRIFEITQSEDKQLGFWFVKPQKGKDIITASDFVSKVIFYLWNDIYKDYGEDATSIFNFSKDGNPESKDRERHSFKQFTPHFKEVDISLVESFLRNLGLSPEEPKQQIVKPIQSEETNTEDLSDEDNN